MIQHSIIEELSTTDGPENDRLLLASIVQASSDLLYIYDYTKGKITYCNASVERVLGYTPEQIHTMEFGLYSLVHPSDGEAAEIYKRVDALGEDKVLDRNYRLRHADGGFRWLHCRNVVMDRAVDGSALRLLGVAHDITNDMRNQALLRKSEERLAASFDSAPFAGCLLAVNTGHLLEVNDAFEVVTGYLRTEAVGRTNKELGLWSSQHDQQKLQKAIAGGAFSGLELRIRTKNGAERIISSSAQEISDDGYNTLVKLFYDITESKRSEEQLLQAIQETMQDASWLSYKVVEKLKQLKIEEPNSAHINDLTHREQQVLALVANGMTNEAIGKELDIKDQTVRNYISNIYEKLNVHSRAEAVVWARERGMQYLKSSD
jgi:PAS domain S-box-containing protein